MNTSARNGILVYCVAAMMLMIAVVAAMKLLAIELGSGRGILIITAAMVTPSLARFVAVHTVDRGWQAPLPLRRWGRPRLAIVLVPLGFVVLVYLLGYGLGSAFDVARTEPTWVGGGQIALNVVFNSILGSLLGLLGAMGEEWGWRGYMQPRLDQMGIKGSLFIVIAVETLFHVPIIVMAGYLAGGSIAVSIALFFGLKLGATPLWTWCTYRFGSIWLAAWFHSIHNALSQGVFPKVFGAGSEQVLGESGILPVTVYVFVAVVVFAGARGRGRAWSAIVAEGLATGPRVARAASGDVP